MNAVLERHSVMQPGGVTIDDIIGASVELLTYFALHP